MSGALPLGWPFKTTRAQALVVESDAKGQEEQACGNADKLNWSPHFHAFLQFEFPGSGPKLVVYLNHETSCLSEAFCNEDLRPRLNR